MTLFKRIANIIPSADIMGTTGGVEKISAHGRRIFPALDGLRGTAILLVLICHYSALFPPSAAAFSGFLVIGWIGVDLFFVLSGFLITGILFDAKGMPHYFRNFYARRTLRIFPLYYGFLAAMFLLLLVLKFGSWKFLIPMQSDSKEGLQLLWNSQPWLWTYTANFWIAMQSVWYQWTEMIMPLWSLSVEEQFYLIWPLVIFLFSHRNLIRICLGIMAGEILVRLILTAGGTDWFALYTLTPTRADSLAAGALLALLMRLPNGEQFARKLYNYAGAVAGLLLVAVSVGGFDPIRHPMLRDLFYSALAIFFSALLFWSIDPVSLRGLPKRFYENRILRAIGGYSYCIYIVHLPLMYLTKNLLAQWGFYNPKQESWIVAATLITLNVTLTVGVAFASFHLYEKQFLKLKRFFPERSIN
jgi:peptidoglycan/LPS O-acetylase OafA/YrhL